MTFDCAGAYQVTAFISYMPDGRERDRWDRFGETERIMPGSFAQSLEKTLHTALQHATDRTHEYATLEHLLLALVDDDDAAQVMVACGVDLAELGETVRRYLDEE